MLLPLLLSAVVVLGLGSYFETSDDGSLAWLFSGVLAAQPVVAVPLYLHGYGHLLAAAYTAAPAGPWLGLLLAGLLAAASVLWFAVLDKLLRPRLRPGGLLLALLLFFGLAWLEHWLWFSHARVALLLAAGGVLFAAQRPGRRGPLLLGLAALLAAWLIRPGLAGLGAGAVLPAVLLLAGGWQRARPLLLSAGLLLALAFGVAALRQTPADARVRDRDARLARILDYEQLRSHPRTPADSLGVAAISSWLLGDSAVVDPVLRGPVYRFDAADFAGRVVPAKLGLRAGLLLRDYFPVLLALLATAGAVGCSRRPAPRGFWLVQLGFAVGLAGLAGILKLPPRLALPLLDCWLLTSLVFWLRTARVAGVSAAGGVAGPEWAAGHPGPACPGNHSAPRLGRPAWSRGQRVSSKLNFSRVGRLGGFGLLVAVVGLYAAKTAHRQWVLQREQRHNQAALLLLRQQSARTVRVLAGPNNLLKSLSPFRSYSPGPGPLLQLTGWPAHDASQTQLRLALTGNADQASCLRRLAQAPSGRPPRPVRWLLTPETARWLNRRFRPAQLRLELLPGASPSSSISAAGAEYRIQSGPMR